MRNEFTTFLFGPKLTDGLAATSDVFQQNVQLIPFQKGSTLTRGIKVPFLEYFQKETESQSRTVPVRQFLVDSDAWRLAYKPWPLPHELMWIL